MKDLNPSAIDSYTVSGFFEGVYDGYAVGWALIKEDLDIKVKIDIVCDGAVVGCGVAREQRQDLKSAFNGDGLHAFKVLISDELYDHRSHALQAKVANTEIEIAGGIRHTGRLNRNREFPIMSRKEGLAGLEKILESFRPDIDLEKRNRITEAFKWASLAQETGQYTASLQMWTAFQKVLGETGLITQKMSESALLDEQYTLAEELAYKSVALNAQSTWSQVALGNINLKMNRFVEAEKFYNLAKACDPKHRIFKVFATSNSDLRTIMKAQEKIANGDLETALGILHESLLQTQSSAMLRKYTEVQCLKIIPDDPHLDIAIKAEAQMEIMKAQTSKIERLMSGID